MDGPVTVVGPGAGAPVLSTSVSGAPVLEVGQKKFFFDPGENEKGKYLRFTEVRGESSVKDWLVCQGVIF